MIPNVVSQEHSIKSSFKNKTINRLSINNNAVLLHFKVTLLILLQTNCIMARMTDLMPEMILFCGDADAVGKFNPMARQDPTVLIRIAATQRFLGIAVEMLDLLAATPLRPI